MFLTKDQLEKRANSEDNLLNQMGVGPNVKVITAHGHGRKSEGGKHKMTPEERVECGFLARTEGKQVAAEVYGVSAEHARKLGQGYRTIGPTAEDNADRKDGELKSAIDAKVNDLKKSVEERCADRILAAIGFLSEEKLANSKATEIASITANLSRTMVNMVERNKEESGGNKVQVIIHQPKPSKEEHFEVIEIGA